MSGQDAQGYAPSPVDLVWELRSRAKKYARRGNTSFADTLTRAADRLTTPAASAEDLIAYLKSTPAVTLAGKGGAYDLAEEWIRVRRELLEQRDQASQRSRS